MTLDFNHENEEGQIVPPIHVYVVGCRGEKTCLTRSLGVVRTWTGAENQYDEKPELYEITK